MNKQLHLISTGQQSVEELVSIIGEIHPYINYVHLRERHWTAAEHIAAITALESKGLPIEKVMINDRVDIAHVSGAAGVQLAHHSLDIATVRVKFPGLKIGQSVQTKKMAEEAEKAGADWLIHGHMYPTASKRGIPPRGLSSLKEITQACHIPIIAIGGITPKRVPDVIQAGAQGVAVLSGILLAENPKRMAKQYRTALDMEVTK